MARRPRRRVQDEPDDLFALAGSPQTRMMLDRETWPDPTQFPVNLSRTSVGQIVLADLHASAAPLVVTGFASISKLIEFICARAGDPRGGSRVLLGTEPFTTRRTSFASSAAPFDDEVRRYWIEEEGVSLLLSAKVVQAIRELEAGHVHVRYVPGRDRLHAKIYLTEQAGMLGSSNFTTHGLRTQLEANARFERAVDDDRLQALSQVAENLWQAGEDWEAQFVELLRSMVQFVPWREALARACADLLEGQWAVRYLAGQMGTAPLWPSQISGIAEALWVVETVGSVLVADATGSGKTRMGAHLTRAVNDRLWSTGRVRHGQTVLVCPPSVEEAWRREANVCGLTLQTVSQGLLSRASKFGPRVQEREVADAQVLAVDEAHNFLSKSSRRTQFVREANPDHVLMFTATPINRGAADLLSLVDLLGADNFDDDTLRVLDNLAHRGTDPLISDSERELLRAEVQRFTVRRTKRQLNVMVEADPEGFRDVTTGRICRYPQHVTRTFPTGESSHDAELAVLIRQHASALTGVTKLGNQLVLPPRLPPGMDEAGWLTWRLGSATGLANYEVLAALRSSRAALLEHLRGTTFAVDHLRIPHLTKPQPSGDQIGKLEAARDRGLPDVQLTCELPDWLADPEAWRHQCEEDLAHYHVIERATRALDDTREHAKADHIADQATRHERVIAFDHLPITLAVLEALLEQKGTPVIVATGAETGNRRKVRHLFAPESHHTGVALCSDAMNEGINLQGASAVIHLDMPTTLRVAEQRVGRVDRMNSPHKTVEVWWPDDGPAFATRAYELLAAREAESSALLGSNLPIPRKPGPVEQIVDHTMFTGRHRDETWDGLRDALEPVRSLVTGPDALISKSEYEPQRHAHERVLSRVSPVRTSLPWAFFAIAGTKHGAPRWLLVEGTDARPTTGLREVTDRLRTLLAEDPPQRDLDDACDRWLRRFLEAAAAAEVDLLPRRYQRALRQMASCAHDWAADARRAGDFVTAERWSAIGRLATGQFEDGTVNLHEAAAAWIAVTRQRREAYRLTHTHRRYFTLSDLDNDLRTNPLELADVEKAATGLAVMPSLDHRISACILGVPD